MKVFHRLFATIFFIILVTSTNAQVVVYSPLVDSLTQEITEESLRGLLNPLTGEVPTTIGGEEYYIATRNAYTEGNELAAQWIFERFQEFGLEPWYQEDDSSCDNVLAKITGTEHPEQQYIICAHYDDMPEGSLAPGADDNASGTVAVLEAARILANQSPKYTIIFALWDEEEYGLIGSEYYAQEAAENGDEILGVINLDMIGYRSEEGLDCSISVNTRSDNEASNNSMFDFVDAMNIYEPEVEVNFFWTTLSDHTSFWDEGYPAFLLHEDSDDESPYYHSNSDEAVTLNIPYLKRLSRATLAGLSCFGFDYFVNIEHSPVPSGPSTADRQAKFIVENLENMDDDENEPRLYYSTDNEEYEYVNAYNIEEDTISFLIPGQPLSTYVNYYFAVQGEDGDYVATLPLGGKGINPPGYEAPDNTFNYIVEDTYDNEFYSTSTPVEIFYNDNIVTDTIFISDEGLILDVDVMLDIEYEYVLDILCSLKGSNDNEVNLTFGTGGIGMNFDETIFDDEAEQSIINGSEPFSGSYQPQQKLSAFDGSNIQGEWVLIFTKQYFWTNYQGVLNNWCLLIEYSPMINVSNSECIIANNALEIYPNPASTILNVKAHFNGSKKANLSIYDMFGRKVKSIAEKEFSTGTYAIMTSIRDLPQGQYFVMLSTESGKIVKKIMILR